MKSAALIVLVLGLAVSPSWGASIAVFSAADCSSCNLTVSAGGTARFYICALPLGFEPFRPDGAEFRVTGLPAGWIVQRVTPNPAANIIVGDPLGAGTNIAFPTGQAGPCVNLFTVDVLATTNVTGIMTVRQHSTPSNLNLQCPVMVMDWPAFTAICVGGGSMLINSADACTVGVQPATWGGVKHLYE